MAARSSKQGRPAQAKALRCPCAHSKYGQQHNQPPSCCTACVLAACRSHNSRNYSQQSGTHAVGAHGCREGSNREHIDWVLSGVLSAAGRGHGAHTRHHRAGRKHHTQTHQLETCIAGNQISWAATPLHAATGAGRCSMPCTPAGWLAWHGWLQQEQPPCMYIGHGIIIIQGAGAQDHALPLPSWRPSSAVAAPATACV
jgi:hypothetical protein